MESETVFAYRARYYLKLSATRIGTHSFGELKKEYS
jgi:hypothetical protein